jgi:hypothetical protein
MPIPRGSNLGTRRLPGLQNYLQSRTTGLSPEPRLGTLPFGDAASQVVAVGGHCSLLAGKCPQPRASVA